MATPTTDQIQGTPFEFEGVPFVGEPFLFKDSDPEYLKPQVCSAHRLNVLRTDKPEDVAFYVRVYDLVAQERATMFYEERHFDEKAQAWTILLSWCEKYAERPNRGGEQVRPQPESESPPSEPGQDAPIL